MDDKTLSVFNAGTALANFEAFQKMSEVFVESKAFSKDMNAAKFVVLMQAWVDLWLNPTESLRSLAVINGNVSMYGTKVIERVRAHGYSIKFEESLKQELYEKDNKKFKRRVGECKATVTKKNTVDATTVAGQEDSRTETYTMEDAKIAWLLSKDNRVKYPKLMLRYRALWMCVKFFCPEVLGGVSMYEEMKDHFGEKQDYEIVEEWDLLDGFGSEVPEHVVKSITKAQDVMEKMSEEAAEAKKEESLVETTVREIVENAGEEKTQEWIVWKKVKHKLLGEWTVEDSFAWSALVKFPKWLKKVSETSLEFLDS